MTIPFNQKWTINAPDVACELIDDELIVINLDSGNYYNSTGVGGFVWDCLTKGLTREQIAKALAKVHALPEADVGRDIDNYIESLLKQSLIRPADDGIAGDGQPPVVPSGNYQPPALSVYSDMKDLLLLDPIHDVGEAGWPIQRQGT